VREILFVEDNDQLRELYAGYLRDAGFSVVEVKLAETALELLGQRTPDLVLLDLGMPPGEMSGIEMLARLRENPAWAEIDVVILSGIGDQINPDLASRLRVGAVLAKAAVRGEGLVRVVRDILDPETGAG
jgi:CheY-like chemotaxis protein